MLRVDVGTSGGPEAAARTARYAALDGGPRRRAGADRPHPRRSGRDGAARARPRLGCALDRGHAAARPAVVPAAARRAPRRDPRRVRGTGADPVARPAQRRPALHPGAAAQPRCCRCWRTSSAAGWPRRWRGPPPALREDTDALDDLAADALADGALGDGRRPTRRRAARRAARRGAAPRHPAAGCSTAAPAT